MGAHGDYIPTITFKCFNINIKFSTHISFQVWEDIGWLYFNNVFQFNSCLIKQKYQCQ